MPNFTAGTTFSANDTVTNTKLNALIADATINPECSFSINSGTIGTLFCTRGTIGTLNSTTGTIPTITTGTTTSTAANITNGTVQTLTASTANITTGTVATLRSTTGTITGLTAGTTTSTGANITNGTIATLNSTTPTFLGAITASTNTINVGNGQIYKDATGNVGINTVSPATKLHAVTSSASIDETIRLENLGSNPDNGNKITWRNASQTTECCFISGVRESSTSGFGIRIGTSPNFLSGGTNAIERLRVDSSGNVGIGVTAPSTKLDVNGTVQLRANGSEGGQIQLLNPDNSTVGLVMDVTSTNNGRIFGGGDNSVLQMGQITGTGGGVSLHTAGTAQLILDSSGNVGIKNSIASAYNSAALDLVVGSGASNSGMTIVSSSTGAGSVHFADGTGVSAYRGIIKYEHTTDSLQLSTSGEERLRISSNGNVGINVNNPGAILHSVSASASTAAGIFQITATSSTSQSAISVAKADALNTTNQNFVLFQVANGATNSGKINANGANAAAFGSTSDRRLKENITALPSQIDNICALNPCEFDYKDGSGHQIGFIAQEMQEVYPDAVGVNEDGMLTITAWSKTEARLVKAIQELKVKNDSLEARLKALEAK
jgi:hypothetical protein